MRQPCYIHLKLHTLGLFVLITILALLSASVFARTQKPVIHGQHWIAVTGKPLAATSGAMIFQQGGNAVDAAMAMLATTSTMWDALSWGGETQALIYDPTRKKIIGVNALGVAPSGATASYFKRQGLPISARHRSAGSGNTWHARWPHDHARRMGTPVACRGAGGRLYRWLMVIRLNTTSPSV